MLNIKRSNELNDQTMGKIFAIVESGKLDPYTTLDLSRTLEEIVFEATYIKEHNPDQKDYLRALEKAEQRLRLELKISRGLELPPDGKLF